VRRFGIGILVTFGALVVLAVLVLVLGVLGVRGSLPPLDGERAVPGLVAPATLERDSLGVAVVRAGGWNDGHFALGFAHGQDRFFQMDLARRQMSGTLSALFGALALDNDATMRAYGFSDAARRHLVALPPRHRETLDAYVAGVNAGLSSLSRRPPEYLLLRQRPEPWSAEDALLVYLNFYFELSTHYRNEAWNRELHAVLPTQAARLLTPETSRFDRPMEVLSGGDPSGGHLPLPIPPPWILDLHNDDGPSPAELLDARRAISIYGDLPGGSNAWAAGVVGGPALVAGDPHLALRVPGIWYRSELHWPGGVLRGATLPGMPGFFVGMSEHLAWSPTAAMVDQTDLVELELDPDDPLRYRVPEGWGTFQVIVDTLRARSAEPRVVERRVTHWGPVVRTAPDGTPLVLRSPAYDVGGLTFEHLEMIRARSVPEAVELARRIGGPGIGLVLGDAEGRVGWIVTGVLPARRGTDGRLPTEGAAGSVAWIGARPEEERPVVVDSAGGFVYTANHRFAALPQSQTFSGAWVSPTRALRIEELLSSDHRPSERLHQGYQLDTRSLEHEFVRTFLLDLLDPEETDPDLQALRQHAEGWNGRADAGAPEFRTMVFVGERIRNAALAPLVALVVREVPEYRYRWLLAHEAAFRILEERPIHLLPPSEESWEDYLLGELRTAAVELGRDGLPSGLSSSRFNVPWGEENEARIRHPFSSAQPALARFLDLSADPLDGWPGAVRAQAPAYGQSLRFVGRPGRPESALLDLPGGQSGHPLSRWYGAGHEAWVQGMGMPLSAGPAEHVLNLVPTERSR
jgi:penicillin G amidase